MIMSHSLKILILPPFKFLITNTGLKLRCFKRFLVNELPLFFPVTTLHGKFFVTVKIGRNTNSQNHKHKK